MSTITDTEMLATASMTVLMITITKTTAKHSTVTVMKDTRMTLAYTRITVMMDSAMTTGMAMSTAMIVCGERGFQVERGLIFMFQARTEFIVLTYRCYKVIMDARTIMS